MAEAYDVIIIGGGIGGAALAANLGSGLKAAILEAEAFAGYHTSGRSAAFFCESYGGPQVTPLTTASLPYFLASKEEGGTPWLGAARGALYVGQAHQREAVQKMRAAYPSLDMHIVDAAEIAARAPVLRPEWRATGLWEPGVADINTDAMHQAFLRRVRRNGGAVLTGKRVTALEREGGNWRVRCGAEEFRAPVVVNAAGAWADEVAQLAGVAPLGLAPLRRTLVVLQTPQGEYHADMPLVLDVDGSFYFKPDAGTYWLSPHDETPSLPCDARPEELDVAIALDRLGRATTLTITRPERSWAGLRTFAPDRAPVYGFEPNAPGFFWCAGQGGFGMQTAPAAGALCASLIRGEALPDALQAAGVRAEAYSPARFRG